MSRTHMSKIFRVALFGLLSTLFSCKTRQFNKTEPDLANANSTTLLVSRNPGLLPSAENKNAWGGSDSSKWKAEAVYANALSDLMNRMWTLSNVRDVVISIPIVLKDSGIFPYGDGQSNTRAEFPGWKSNTVPLRTALVHFTTENSSIFFEFSADLNLNQKEIEIVYKSVKGSAHTLKIAASKNGQGQLVAEWKNIPDELELNLSGKTDEERAKSSGNGAALLVRPAPGFQDWFPLSFKHPWSSIDQIQATVPVKMAAFDSATQVPAPNRLSDPLNFAQKDDADDLPFDKAYALSKANGFPTSFNNEVYPHSEWVKNGVCNVHGSFTKDDSPHDPTAVGRNWTWLTNPHDADRVKAGKAQGPFKILYTCFEARRTSPGVKSDAQTCDLTATEESEGVPSGGGWHRIGDEAETLFNSVERVPLLMSAGFGDPAGRIGLSPPAGSGYAFQLEDVATSRWLWPQEAFLTSRALDLTDSSHQNFHWFLFHALREVCTLEWVHDCRPDDSGLPSLGCK